MQPLLIPFLFDGKSVIFHHRIAASHMVHFPFERVLVAGRYIIRVVPIVISPDPTGAGFIDHDLNWGRLTRSRGANGSTHRTRRIYILMHIANVSQEVADLPTSSTSLRAATDDIVVRAEDAPDPGNRSSVIRFAYLYRNQCHTVTEIDLLRTSITSEIQNRTYSV